MLWSILGYFGGTRATPTGIFRLFRRVHEQESYQLIERSQRKVTLSLNQLRKLHDSLKLTVVQIDSPLEHLQSANALLARIEVTGRAREIDTPHQSGSASVSSAAGRQRPLTLERLQRPRKLRGAAKFHTYDKLTLPPQPPESSALPQSAPTLALRSPVNSCLDHKRCRPCLDPSNPLESECLTCLPWFRSSRLPL
jgi:hypothetical protein